MELSLDTFLKTDPAGTSETIGRTTLTVAEKGYAELEELEAKLKDSNEQELTVAVHSHSIDFAAPDELGALKDQQVRVFLDGEDQTGHFHLVAKRAADEALVYTEPSMIRLVAV